MAEKDNQFKGLNLSKDLRDFYYHCSISLKGEQFFEQFDDEFQTFIKQKTQNRINDLQRKIQ